MKKIFLPVVLLIAAIPVAADTHDADQTCEERLQAIEATVRDRMENASSAEERRNIEERFEPRLEEIQDECEEDQRRSDRARRERSATKNISTERVIEWSEDYPEVGSLPTDRVDLTDDELDIVKDNMVSALSNPEQHLPEELSDRCLEEARAVAGSTQDEVKQASSMNELIDIHRDSSQEIEDVLRSSDCREEVQPRSASSSGQVAKETAPQPNDEVRNTMNELQDTVATLKERIDEHEQTISQLQDKVERLSTDDAESHDDEETDVQPREPRESQVRDREATGEKDPAQEDNSEETPSGTAKQDNQDDVDQRSRASPNVTTSEENETPSDASGGLLKTITGAILN